MLKCIVCGREVSWTDVQEVFEHIFEQADHYGIESLTEHQQVACEGQVCSEECYDRLK